MEYKEVCYDMNHKRRGHCVIFNNNNFDPHTGLSVSNSDNNANKSSIIFPTIIIIISAITNTSTGWQPVFQHCWDQEGPRKMILPCN